MSIVAGLLHADAGSIDFFPGGRETAAADDRRQYMEYLPAEANGLYLKMDATHNLLFWSALRGESVALEAVFKALERWNLNHALLRDNFPVEKFSTGMKRRLALARLALSPAPLWLLDEPLYGLDTQATGVFQDLLSEHLTAGGMALLVSHDLKPIEGLITRTLALAPPTRSGGGQTA
jgi:heme exporter protein A